MQVEAARVLTQARDDDFFGSFRVLADTLPQLVLYIDHQEICRAHNIAVENVLGLSAEQIDLRSLREVAGGASYECIRTWVVRALAGEQVYLRQVHRTAGGKVLSFEARYAPHLAADGRVLGFCAILAPLWMSDDAGTEAKAALPPDAAENDAAAADDEMAASELSLVKHDQALRRVTSALQGNRFCLYQQPIVAIGSAHAEPRSFEVLLRLRDEDHRLIHPAAFLQEAEDAGCMAELDRWVVDRLVNWYVQERATSGSDEQLRLHINLSMSSIRDGSFSADLRQVIESHRLPADMLCFEINESDLARHRLEVMSCIQALRILGCRVGLDRFTGVSGAFSALLDLPIDFVKIDGSIVAGMRTDARDRAKMRIIAKIAHTAGLAAIAERVEDESTIDVLRALGIGFVQGYGVSMPEPLIG
jgi:PAS domain S-box-containing protein